MSDPTPCRSSNEQLTVQRRILASELQVYIINLDESRSRWIQCFRRMSAFFRPGQIQRVPALDGRSFADHGASSQWRPEVLRQLQREGYVGLESVPDPIRTALCLSHQRALRLFLDRCAVCHDEAAWALVLEDDAHPAGMLLDIPTDDFVLNVPEDAEMILLHDRAESQGGGQQMEIQHGSEQLAGLPLIWRKVSGGIGLEGYLVSLSGARKMIEAWRPLFAECDVQLMAFWSNSIDTRWRTEVLRLRKQNSKINHPEIRGYMPHRPLIQIDEAMPSVKFQFLKELEADVPDREDKSSSGKSLSFDFQSPMAFATCWFNPFHYRSRVENIMRFLDQKTLPNLVVVELAFGEDDWQLPDDIPNLIRLRSDTLCWQKEALLNHGLSLLYREKFPYLGWLDADVIFDTPDWQGRLQEALQQKRLCQVFETAETVFPDRGLERLIGAAAAWLKHDTHPTQCRVTGFGWTMRREVWGACKLYDVGLLGGGDYVMWRSVFMNALDEKRLFSRKSSTEHFLDWRKEWALKWSEAVRLSLGYPKNVKVSSLPHGRESDRQYRSRHDLLKGHGFVPDLHLTRDGYGLLQWQDETPLSLKEAVRGYFARRKEDAVA